MRLPDDPLLRRRLPAPRPPSGGRARGLSKEAHALLGALARLQRSQDGGHAELWVSEALRAPTGDATLERARLEGLFGLWDRHEAMAPPPP